MFKGDVIENEKGQNTHSKGEWLKIPFLPNNVGKGEYKLSRDHPSGHNRLNVGSNYWM